MKNLSKKIRNGGVQKFSGSQLGVSKTGKGSFPRWNHMCDEKYAENFNRIFKKKHESNRKN